MISVVLTTFNEENNIESLLKDFKSQSLIPEEIVIVDGGSSDRTVEIIKSFKGVLNINLIIDKTLNKKFHDGPIAAARNRAVDNAKHEKIIVTDAGCRLDRNFVLKMSNALNKNKIVAGYYSANPNSIFEKKMKDIFIPTLKKFRKNSFLPSSRSIGFRKKCWASVGGYPENSYTAEDTKFAINLKNKFGSFYKEEKAIVYWDLPSSKFELREKVMSYANGDRKQRLFKVKYIIKYILVKSKLSLFYSYLKFNNNLLHEIYRFEVIGYFK